MVDFSQMQMRHERAERMFARPDVALFVNQPCVNGTITPHLYDDFLMMSLITGGRGVRRTIHADCELQQGNIYVTRPGSWHAYHSCRDLAVLNLAMGLDLLHRELGWLHHEPGTAYLLHRREPMRGGKQAVFMLDEAHLRKCADCHEALRVAMQQKPPVPRGALITTLMVLLETVRDGLSAQMPQGIPADQADARVTAVVDAVSRHMDRAWDLDAMAQLVHLERSYFVRLFRKVMGLPPMAYLTQQRLDRAALLLVSTGLPVGEIGKRIGIDEPAAMSRAFRKRFGQSPMRYREGTRPG